MIQTTFNFSGQYLRLLGILTVGYYRKKTFENNWSKESATIERKKFRTERI